MRVGCMAWRIGSTVDLRDQLAWLAEHGFEAVSFWTCAGQPGVWEGFDALTAGPADVKALQRALQAFPVVDLHAHLTSPDPQLERVVAFAGEVGADTVTVHLDAADVPALDQLNDRAESAGVRIGLELTEQYDLALRPEAPRVGLTLDVGHVCFEDGAGYREFGSIPGLIEHIGDRLFHVHVHDYDGDLDHLPLGKGFIDFPGIVRALAAGGYEGVLCLELNPGRATPGELLQSRDRLEALIREAG